MYSLVYLPLAKEDMVDIARYISGELHNPTAAARLAEKMVERAQALCTSPYMCPAYIPAKRLKNEYRKLIVDNFVLFYYVSEKDKTVTVARVLYAKRDCARLLE